MYIHPKVSFVNLNRLVKNYAYDFEIETLVTQFMSAIDDVIVKRYNKSRVPEQQIKVRFVYAPKQRVLLDIVDKAQSIQLPVVACYITGINRDPSRVFNKIQGQYIPSTTNPTEKIQDGQPVPIDVGMGVTIMTRFQSDLDQILSNLLSYLNPYLYISWRTPGRPDHEIRSQVIWNGSANISYPYDINSSQNARVVADLSFTVKGWLFQALPTEGTGTILTIHSIYSNEHHGIPCEYSVDQFEIDSLITDFITISGTPPQPNVVDPYWGKVGEAKQFGIYGKGMTSIANVYLSGLPFSAIHTLQNPFSGSPVLSAVCPSFSAIKVDSTDWSYNKDSYLTFVMPSAASAGFVDVILEGPTGYGSLTDSVRVNTFNPFISGTAAFQDFIPYQVPFLSGIEIHP